MTLNVNSASGALAALQALSSTSASSVSTSSASGSTSSASNPTASASNSLASVVSGSGASQALFAAVDGVGQALSAADAAGAAGQTVVGLLQQMRDAAEQAGDPQVDGGRRADLHRAFFTAAGSVAAALSGATVNGANLIDGSTSAGLKASLGGGATASLTPLDLNLGGPTLNLPANVSVATATAAASAVSALGDAIGAAGKALSTLQAQADQLRTHGSALQALGGALASPGDDSGDSVRLMALQIGQQLSITQGSVANTAPQSILSLFRS